MTGAEFTDELLMGFVDGEVDPRTAERIEAAMRGDTDVAARIELFMQTRALAKNALEPLLKEPVPASLTSSVEGLIERHRQAQDHADGGGQVIPLRTRRPLPAPGRRWAVPLAASIAAVLAGLGGFWLGAKSGPQMLSLGIIAEPGLSEALATVPAGGEREIPKLGRLRVVSSFRDRGGDLCRELELNPPQGSALAFVACHMEHAWATTFAVAMHGDDGSYASASSMDALDAYLSSIDASPSLTVAEEKHALDGSK